MGLGTVLLVEQRTVTVLFPATGDTRTYAQHSAPLTRVRFAAGDSVRSHDGAEIKITDVIEKDGLLTYIGATKSGQSLDLEEADLDIYLQLNKPADRLFNGQIDRDNWFRLRYATLEQRNRLASSMLYGLTGSRTSLIPHQLYIAHEVANRYAPRVLLADEVGLGKTIEAGLILHHQLLTERARRVLIVVPETLLHQWLVEMLRRFNLHFRIFDEQRCEDLQQQAEYDNIFHAEQQVLCSIDFLRDNPDIYQHCLAADWDLMVVDEAHHLEWSVEQPSLEYTIVESLSRVTRGVLLLTATPEQLGKQSHFARLRLLDADRFPDYHQFIEEEKNYQPYARLIEDLLDGEPADIKLDKSDIELLRSTFDEGDNQQHLDTLLDTGADNQSRQSARSQLIDHLLDRHGTGRVLFRNTRAAVKGFPERKLHSYALDAPEGYSAQVADNTDISALLSPEQSYHGAAGHWTTLDPRISWLSKTCADLLPEKVLVITAKADTALDIVDYLKMNTRLHATAFHEGLSIIERDRAAAFFADSESGSQVLVCSEIGSEGRNFQFSHHLILFDLPLNPDLLEQRIGRLDRIGQRDTVNIHVPYLANSPQYALFRWYHEGLRSFEHTCPTGHAVYNRVHNELHRVLLGMSRTSGIQSSGDELDTLIRQTRQHHDELSESLSKGRDRLLEYNSCRPAIAQSIKTAAEQQDRAAIIQDYMEQVYDCFGIDFELHSEDCYVLNPTEHMVSRFPGLSDEGTTVTYVRDAALSYEDAQYLSWEHPLVSTAMDMVLSRESGNTSLVAVKDLPASLGLTAGGILLECLFSLEAPPVEALQSDRYLPPTMVRVVCDEKGRDISRRLSHDTINAVASFVEQGVAVKVIAARRQLLKAMQQRSEAYASNRIDTILSQAHENAMQILSNEINRLNALYKVNPNIRASEIEYFQKQLDSLNTLIDQAGLRFDAMRVIVVT